MHQKTFKDRDVLKKLDFDLARYTLVCGISYMLLAAVLLVDGHLFKQLPVLTVMLLGLLILTNALRTLSAFRFVTYHAQSPLRWRQWVLMLTQFNAALWSIFLCTYLIVAGFNSYSFLALIFTISVCSSVVWVLAPYLKVMQYYLSFQLLPIMAVGMFMMSAEGYLLSSVTLLYYSFLCLQAERLHHSYWVAIDNSQQLKNKALNLEIAKQSDTTAAAAKDRMLGYISGRVRTPLSNVLGMLSLLGDTGLSKEQEEFQRVAMQLGEKLLNFIDELGDLTKLLAREITTEKSVFNLRKNFEEELDILGPCAHHKGIELSCIYDASLPLRVRGDSAKFSQILRHLLHYSLEHIKTPEVIIRIKPLSSQTGIEFSIHFSDLNKENYAWKQLSYLFSTTELDIILLKHMEIGLLLAKGWIHCTQGTIEPLCTDKVAQGLVCKIPLEFSSQQTQIIKPDKHLKTLKALLVNATPGMTEALITDLTGWGIRVDETHDTEKALQMLKGVAIEGYAYNAVVVNLPLAVSNEFKFIQRLAEDPLFKQTKIIVLSSLAQRGSDEALYYQTNLPQLKMLTKPTRQLEIYDLLMCWFSEQQIPVDDGKVIKALYCDSENRIKVLLVEDNKVNQMVVRKLLQKLGCVIKIVENGREALGALEQGIFDLILMDCQMPKMDGYETTRLIRLRELNNRQHIPIIAMTAHTFENDESRCLAAGMNDYMAKPIKLESLDSKLKRWAPSHHILFRESSGTSYAPQYGTMPPLSTMAFDNASLASIVKE